MSTHKVSMVATVLALALFVPAAPASAHDDDDSYYRYGYYSDRHARDHARHGRFHRRIDGEHDRAHSEGFYSREEHRAYHRYQRHRHGHFHDDHPGTRHDHYPRGHY